MKTYLVLAAGVSAVAFAASANAAPRLIPNQYVCTFDASVSAREVPGHAQRAAAAQRAELMHVYKKAVKGFAVKLPPGASISAMKRGNSAIASCEQDQIFSLNGPKSKGKPTPSQPAQTTPWGITRVGGAGAAISGRTAYVIDSGVDLDHPDLNVDVGRSVSYVRGDADDENGHGTHVAGTIAALDNSIGVIGVAPGATIVAVRVLDRRGSGSTSGVIAGVDYVAANGKSGDVANMSLGGGVSTTLDNAVISAAANSGVRFVLAAGNENDHANNHSPARANGTNVYTVSAMDSSDRIASFSNYGNPPVDYAEPGVSVYSTYKDGGYATLSGTSMAAPHLAGILMTGNVSSGGTLASDKDSNPDVIGVR